MSFESLMGASQRLSVSLETLAALGAQLRFQQNGIDGDPRVRALLNDVACAIDPELLEGVELNQQASVLALIRIMFRQGLELLENPERPPGWSYQDPDILESQGQLSRLIVRWIEAIAAQRPELSEVLGRPGAFLDVGTGVGAIAIEAARSWPALRVVGIDPWEPALTLARKNLAESGFGERVEFRAHRVEQLEETATFSVAWVPGPFIPRNFATCCPLSSVHFRAKRFKPSKRLSLPMRSLGVAIRRNTWRSLTAKCERASGPTPSAGGSTKTGSGHACCEKKEMPSLSSNSSHIPLMGQPSPDVPVL
jgi:SAM-dependent methyltransferase